MILLYDLDIVLMVVVCRVEEQVEMKRTLEELMAENRKLKHDTRMNQQSRGAFRKGNGEDGSGGRRKKKKKKFGDEVEVEMGEMFPEAKNVSNNLPGLSSSSSTSSSSSSKTPQLLLQVGMTHISFISFLILSTPQYDTIMCVV